MKRNPKVASPRIWYLLIHRLPPQPLYLRAKIRQRLARVGAVALKRSVYVLPARPNCLHDFESIAQEAGAGGGEAYVCEAKFPDRSTDLSLVASFRAERGADYGALAATMEGWRGRPFLAEEAAARAAAARKSLAEISAVDFFEADGGGVVDRLLQAVDKHLRARTAAAESPARPSAARRLVGRTWVTRRGIQVDRIASAWLVRRFVDRKARFRFFQSGREDGPGAREISFDMVGGEFTHEGDRCTFETLLVRTGLGDRALAQIGEVVHDIDLKDNKFGRPEAAGVEIVLRGLILANPGDEARLERGIIFFDDLYQSFRAERRPFSKEAFP